MTVLREGGGNLCMSIVCIQNNDLSMLSESAILMYILTVCGTDKIEGGKYLYVARIEGGIYGI